ncbi:hypothetical protein NV379_18700 [Paenibacillus sp. N1-5-1-14]|uniref:hypothetical protein n=1 Tax=Paenibacillus radicibacter TaxID=2972488 RepID=UPI00215980DA|nr:hypothetical protein [Paenibacillus radicibacter]MCR8644687.1 hypothetical protein [Paenibacillus radicibacter]
MNFAQSLASYIGRTVEVFQANSYLEGQLLSVNDGYIVVRVVNPSYQLPPADTTVLFPNIQFVRVLVGT